MSFTDSAGREWLHHLRVEMTYGEKSVATYFIEFLTLDFIDETGKRPIIEYNEEREEKYRNIYWNELFTLLDLTQMCQSTLPEQIGIVSNLPTYCDDSDCEDCEDHNPRAGPELILRVWYDNSIISWEYEEE